MRKWWRGLRYRDCRTCGQEFRRHPCTMPSLVGFAYCSRVCEHLAWDRWVRDER